MANQEIKSVSLFRNMETSTRIAKIIIKQLKLMTEVRIVANNWAEEPGNILGVGHGLDLDLGGLSIAA